MEIISDELKLLTKYFIELGYKFERINSYTIEPNGFTNWYFERWDNQYDSLFFPNYKDFINWKRTYLIDRMLKKECHVVE